jgi:hypothetical protein
VVTLESASIQHAPFFLDVLAPLHDADFDSFWDNHNDAIALMESVNFRSQTP